MLQDSGPAATRSRGDPWRGGASATADPTPCALCWEAGTYREAATGVVMAYCKQGLWLEPVAPQERMVRGRVRRIYYVCPAYDDEDS